MTLRHEMLFQLQCASSEHEPKQFLTSRIGYGFVFPHALVTDTTDGSADVIINRESRNNETESVFQYFTARIE